MKKYKKLLGPSYVYMTDGVHEFDGVVVHTMHKIRLWDDMYHSYKLSKNGLDFHIAIGGQYNARFFKSDGQRYCVNLFVANKEKCYLHSCLTSFSMKEIEKDISNMMSRVDKFETSEFEAGFNKTYEWQKAILETLTT